MNQVVLFPPSNAEFQELRAFRRGEYKCILYRVCSQCKALMGVTVTTDFESRGRQSHGLCSGCLAPLMEEIELVRRSAIRLG